MSVQAILEDCAALYDGKASVYAPSGDPWENFRFSADYRNNRRPTHPPMDYLDACLVLIGLKESRLRTLARIEARGGKALYEKKRDTQNDRINYEAILVAMEEELTLADIKAGWNPGADDRAAVDAFNAAAAELSAGLSGGEDA